MGIGNFFSDIETLVLDYPREQKFGKKNLEKMLNMEPRLAMIVLFLNGVYNGKHSKSP